MTVAKPNALPKGVVEIAGGDLTELTTFRVPARAARLFELRDAGALEALLAFLPAEAEPLVLGGGSNLLLTHDLRRPVIWVRNRGIAQRDADDETKIVSAAAGENWDAFVRWTLSAGLAGLENLILIPGTVGAAPIQNIGAYGVEVSDRIHAVHAWDRRRDMVRRLTREECRFAYRDSRFKRSPGRYIVTRVEFRLARQPAPLCLEYAGVRAELSAASATMPTAADVAAAVERLRRRKLPDPARLGNAGSFFKNPVVIESKALELQRYHPDLPVFPMHDGNIKLSAAWLIERCGFKGYREEDAGVSEQHALVLVNYGKATGAQLWALATDIREAVEERFGIWLDPEPLVL